MQQREERPADASPGALCIYRAGRPFTRTRGVLACLLLSLLLAGCSATVQTLVTPFTNVRPIAQVGVLAPFEGLYRRSGYAALEGARAAVAAAPPARTGIIPLALDTSRDPARAAAKIAAGANVAAVVGPLTPQEGAAAAPALESLTWFAPYAVTDEGFTPPQEPRWLVALLAAVGEAAQAQGARRILVGGILPEFAYLLSEGIGPLPTIQYSNPNASADAPVTPQPGDALLWLGSASDGAAATHSVQTALPSAVVWLAPWAVDPVFFEHLAAASGSTASEDSVSGSTASESTASEGSAAADNIFSVLWVGPNYAQWAEAHPQLLPSAYLMYEAAVQASAAATAGPQWSRPAQARWQVHAVPVGPDGVRMMLP